MSKRWVQDSVEIENPYRYRGYFVGQKPIFNIQNNAYSCIDHGKVVSIEESNISDTETVGYMSAVTFEDDAVTYIQNGAGYITSGHWEGEDETRV